MSIRLHPGSLLVSKFCSLLLRPFWGRFIPQRRVLFRNDPRGLIGLSALFTLYYPPKESSLDSPEGSLWFEWLSLPCLVVFGFLAPTTVSLIVRTADGRTDGTGVFTFPYCFFEKTRDFFFILMSLVIRGNDFKFFYCNNKPKIELVGRKLTQKSTLFARLASVIWPFWGSIKSFSGLFRSF